MGFEMVTGKWKAAKKLRPSSILLSSACLMMPRCGGRWPDVHASDDECGRTDPAATNVRSPLEEEEEEEEEEEDYEEFGGFHLNTDRAYNASILRSPLLTSPLSSPLKIAADASSAPKSPPTTPRGYLAVYVGGNEDEKPHRVLVRTRVLNHPQFGILLDKARDEFGFEHSGPLTIPCDLAFFHHIVLSVESSSSSTTSTTTTSSSSSSSSTTTITTTSSSSSSSSSDRRRSHTSRSRGFRSRR